MTALPNRALTAAVIRLLRPLVRILLRNGVSYGAFADVAKWVFVEVAESEFAIKGRKQSVSRVSVITGLSRKEVSRVQGLNPPEEREAEEKYNRAARVIGGWVRNPLFHGADGEPAALPFEGPSGFSELVKRHSGDVPARAILDELKRVDAVEQDEVGLIHLRTRAYVPQTGEADKLNILGTDVALLVNTIDHNLKRGGQPPYYQRKVAYDNLPQEAMAELRAMSAEKSQRLLEQLDGWLNRHDRDTNPAVQGTGRKRAGIGIYYFEEDVPEEK